MDPREGEELSHTLSAMRKAQPEGVRAKSLQSCPTLCDPMDCTPPGSLSMGFSGKNTGVGRHALLQGIPTCGSSPCLLCLLRWQAGSLLLVPPGL